VYNETAHKVVVDVLNGFNSCILCYGQTGSGKSFTMFGPDGELEKAVGELRLRHDLKSPTAGIALRACNELLSLANGSFSLEFSQPSVTVSMQYVEIYQNAVTDLLTGRQVSVSGFGQSVVLAGWWIHRRQM
jgi:kinesin family member 5